MLKVVIVDDELIVRVGFRSCIRWEDYGCEIAATCESAEDAIALFKKEIPDIVFTDIMMPGMDGIALTEYIRNHYPRVKIVVLSCVNEIDYVKKAIKLGAEDYILKLSFTQDTMAEVIGKLREVIEKERKESFYSGLGAVNREEPFRALLSGNLPLAESEKLLEKLGYPGDCQRVWYVGCFLIDHFKTVKGFRGANLQMMRHGLLNIVREYLTNLEPFELVFAGENEFALLLDRQMNEPFSGNFQEMLNGLNGALRTHFNLTLSMGMDVRGCSGAVIPAHYKYARELAQLRFFDGSGSYHQEEPRKGEGLLAKRKIQKKIQAAIFKQDEKEVKELSDLWFEDMKEPASFGQIQNIRRFVVETWVFISGYSLPEAVEESGYDGMYSTAVFWEAETLAELKQAFQEGVGMILKYLQANRAANPEIIQLIQYLENHIGENISLEHAAGRCALGKSQFCILFKKHTGETFVNYFNHLKMKRAYELLRCTNLQVQEVANQIGIRDISYFSRMFKKYYQISPSDVKKR